MIEGGREGPKEWNVYFNFVYIHQANKGRAEKSGEDDAGLESREMDSSCSLICFTFHGGPFSWRKNFNRNDKFTSDRQ